MLKIMFLIYINNKLKTNDQFIFNDTFSLTKPYLSLDATNKFEFCRNKVCDFFHHSKVFLRFFVRKSYG